MQRIAGGSGHRRPQARPTGAASTSRSSTRAWCRSAASRSPAASSTARTSPPSATTDDLRNLDTFGHGTHLAGLIAGRDPITGFAGVAPGARLVSLKIAGADGETNLARVLGALEWIRRNHDAPGYNIRVVNLSLGVAGRRLPLRRARLGGRAAVERGHRRRGGRRQQRRYARTLDMPADDPFVIAAGARTRRNTANPADDRVADFSSRSRCRASRTWSRPARRSCRCACPARRSTREFPGARDRAELLPRQRDVAGRRHHLRHRGAAAQRAAVAHPGPAQGAAGRGRRRPAGSAVGGRRRAASTCGARSALPTPTPEAASSAGRRRCSTSSKLRRELDGDDEDRRPGRAVERAPLVRSPLVGPPLVWSDVDRDSGRLSAASRSQR